VATERPVVALMTPDKPTVVLSQPETPKPAASAVAIDTVEIEPGGKFHMSGHAHPGAVVRLYLNNSFVATATAAADGRFAVTINEGVVTGNYRVRVDEMESNAGTVRARAEVPFNVPGNVAAASTPPPAAAAKPPDVTAPQKPQQAAAATVTPDPARSADTRAEAQADVPGKAVTAAAPPPTAASKASDAAASQLPQQTAAASVQPEAGSPSVVVIPKIATTTVSRGDSLWRISRLSYGAGTRYAVIYEANRQQIRNPDLIYPGQVFVIPTR
jgi:nucleoid-associated protein YgaU